MRMGENPRGSAAPVVGFFLRPWVVTWISNESLGWRVGQWLQALATILTSRGQGHHPGLLERQELWSDLVARRGHHRGGHGVISSVG